VLPKQNEKNVMEDLTPAQRADLTFHYVRDMDEVLKITLPPLARRVEAPRYEDPRPRFGLA